MINFYNDQCISTLHIILFDFTDSDGDLIAISSDEELVEALDQFDGTVFRLYLKRRSDFQVRGPFGIPCPVPPQSCDQEEPTTVESEEDGSQQQQQPATDGDSSGQQQQQSEQPPQSGGQSQQQDGVFHPGVVCDGCNGPIHGTRFKCLVCNDYDLCSGCEAQGKHVDHNMVTITDPFSYSPWGFKNPWAHGFGGGHPCHGWWGQRGGHHPHRFSHHGGHHHGFRPHHPPHGFGPGSGCPPFGASPWGGFSRGGGSCPRGGFRGRRCGGGGSGGGAPWWWRSAAEREAGQQQQQQTSGGAAEPMETATDSQQQQQPPSEEERRSFLHGVGQAVSSFLEPFGVKVDVDVVGDGDKTTPSAPPPSSGEAGPTAAEVRIQLNKTLF